MQPQTETRGRWALLVGIDKYPHLDSRRQLGGCSNDVAILKDALVRRFGFPEEGIATLLNEAATRDALVRALDDLAERAGEDDIVVFHFSGHGSKRRDGPEKDEPDGFDETLVPYDSGRFDEANLDVTDDEIYDWLQRLTAKTPYVTLIFDCCHSGTASRLGKVRKLADDKRPFEKLGAPPPRLNNGGDGQGTGPSGWLPLGQRYTLFAACGSLESANEIQLAEKGKKKTPYGALTYFLVNELMSAELRGSVTATEVFERLVPRLKSRCELQNPQLEGARDRELFGMSTIQPMSFVSVLERKGDRVTLAGGLVCGLRKGSRWTVHSASTRSITDDTVPLGTVEVVSVGATTCEARIVEEKGPDAVAPGRRAVEQFRPLEEGRLAVAILTPPGHPGALELATRIRKSTLLESVVDGEPDVRVRLLAPRGEVRDDDPVPDLGALTEETWVAEEDGRPLGPAIPRGQPKALEIVAENLEAAARLRIVADLRSPESALAGLVDLELLRRDGDGCVEPERDENGEVCFHEGDRLAFAIHNRSSRPFFFYLLDVGLTGRVCQAYPPIGGHKELERGQRLVVGTRLDESLPFFFPADFASLPEASRQRARETLKLIVTTKPADFRPLFQNGYRFRGVERGDGTARSLEEVLAGRLGLASYRGTARGPGQDDWTTVERSFRLLPRRSS